MPKFEVSWTYEVELPERDTDEYSVLKAEWWRDEGAYEDTGWNELPKQQRDNMIEDRIVAFLARQVQVERDTSEYTDRVEEVGWSVVQVQIGGTRK